MHRCSWPRGSVPEDYEPFRYMREMGMCLGRCFRLSASFMLLKLVAWAMSAHSSGDAFTPRNSPSLLTTLTGSWSANNPIILHSLELTEPVHHAHRIQFSK